MFLSENFLSTFRNRAKLDNRRKGKDILTKTSKQKSTLTKKTSEQTNFYNPNGRSENKNLSMDDAFEHRWEQEELQAAIPVAVPS